jgi:hypothetical protein
MQKQAIDILRYRLLNNFEEFTIFFFEHLNKKKFTVNSHHKTLFNFGTKVANGETTRLILNIAPRYGKTEVMVKMFIAWSLARNPASRFIHLSYSDSLALDNSSEIKDTVQSDVFQWLFPYVEVKNDAKAKEKWYTTAGGGVIARSSSGQVTGFGAGVVDYDDDELIKFGGAIIIDDPIKPDDALSDVKRDLVNQKFDTTIRNRVNSRKTPIIIIMQRLHPEDLCGYLLEKEGDDWEVVRMPVINDDGSALWSSKHNIDELEKMRERLGTIFETQYMQNPEPVDGFLLHKDSLKFYPNNFNEDVMTRVVFVDASEKGGDMMCAIFIEVSMFNGRMNFHVYDVIHSDKGFDFLSELIHDKAIETGVSDVVVEKNGVGLATVFRLSQLNFEKKYTLIPYYTTENKIVKILRTYEFIQMHFSFNSAFENGNTMERRFLKDLTTYSQHGNNNHKSDAIDVCASASVILRKKYQKLLELK